MLFLVRLQGKFEIDHSWEWQGFKAKKANLFHLSSEWWVATFFILWVMLFLVRLQGKFEIDHSWEWTRVSRQGGHFVSSLGIYCTDISPTAWEWSCTKKATDTVIPSEQNIPKRKGTLLSSHRRDLWSKKKKKMWTFARPLSTSSEISFRASACSLLRCSFGLRWVFEVGSSIRTSRGNSQGRTTHDTKWGSYSPMFPRTSPAFLYPRKFEGGDLLTPSLISPKIPRNITRLLGFQEIWGWQPLDSITHFAKDSPEHHPPSYIPGNLRVPTSWLHHSFRQRFPGTSPAFLDSRKFGGGDLLTSLLILFISISTAFLGDSRPNLHLCFLGDCAGHHVGHFERRTGRANGR